MSPLVVVVLLLTRMQANKVSLQSSVRLGRIISPTSRRLSRRALALLRSSSDSFRETYGDYYLYALGIGGDTSTLLSTASSADLQNEMRDIEIKACTKASLSPQSNIRSS